MRKIFLTIMAVLLLNLSTASAVEVWTLPENGLVLDDSAKQKYIADKMAVDLHPDNPNYQAATFEVPDGWIYEKFDVDGVPVECLENPAAENNRVILQLHGGGYVLPLGNGHRNLAVKQAVLADASKVYLVDYRIAPENVYPAAFEDAFIAYTEILLRGTNPEDIIVIGDSAGGNLALALSLYLRDEMLPQPKMLVLISPWTTMTTNLPSRKYNETRDLVLGKDASPLYYAVKKPAYAKGFSLKDPRLSPMYADLTNLPPMLIQAGSYELFVDECLELAKKATADGVKVTLTVYPHMPHDFAMLLPELNDSIESFREIQYFVEGNF